MNLLKEVELLCSGHILFIKTKVIPGGSVNNALGLKSLNEGVNRYG